MLVRKTHRAGSRKGMKKSFTRKLNFKQREQVGCGEEEEDKSGITELFSLPFSLGGEEESKEEPKEEPREEPKEKLSDVSPVQSSFETYYGVDSGDVVADKPVVDYPNLHNDLLEKENGKVVFKKRIKKGEDVAILYHSSIGFKNGIFKYPSCEYLENVSFPNSPPNVVVEIKKLPMASEDRKGVYVKTMALVLKTLEEVLSGTILNLPYLPSLSSTKYSVPSSIINEVSISSPNKEEDENEDEDIEEDLGEEEVRIGSMNNDQEEADGSMSVISMEDLTDISTPQLSELVESVEPNE